MANTEKSSKDLLPALQKEVSPVVKRAEEIEIKDEDSKQAATIMLSDLNRASDAAEAEKKRITDPANLILKNERSRWKPLETILGTGIDILRAKLGRYQTEQKKIADAAAAKVAERVGEGRGKLQPETAVKKIAAIEKPSTVVETASGTLKFRTDKKLKITDPSAVIISAVKNSMFHLLVINERALLEYLKEGNKLNGAEIEEVQTPINSR